MITDCTYSNHGTSKENHSEFGCPRCQIMHSKVGPNDLDVFRTIGTGTFGKVYICRFREHPRRYFALKSMAKETVVRLKQLDHVFNERNILFQIKFPFIVRLYNSFQTPTHIHLLLEYVVGGELFTYLRRLGRFSVEAARFYASEMLLALEHLHQNSIVYRDLKPENILLDSRGHIKITDFGFAKVIRDHTYTLCGTPEYLAPEIIRGNGYQEGVDWWALGILVYEMLVGYPPFMGDSTVEIYEKILKGDVRFPSFVDPLSKDLVSKLLSVDRTRRLGFESGGFEIASHLWFNGVNWKLMLQRSIEAPFIPNHSYPGDTQNYEVYPPSKEALDTKEYPHDYLFQNF